MNYLLHTLTLCLHHDIFNEKNLKYFNLRLSLEVIERFSSSLNFSVTIRKFDRGVFNRKYFIPVAKVPEISTSKLSANTIPNKSTEADVFSERSVLLEQTSTDGIINFLAQMELIGAAIISNWQPVKRKEETELFRHRLRLRTALIETGHSWA